MHSKLQAAGTAAKSTVPLVPKNAHYANKSIFIRINQNISLHILVRNTPPYHRAGKVQGECREVYENRI